MVSVLNEWYFILRKYGHLQTFAVTSVSSIGGKKGRRRQTVNGTDHTRGI